MASLRFVDLILSFSMDCCSSAILLRCIFRLFRVEWFLCGRPLPKLTGHHVAKEACAEGKKMLAVSSSRRVGITTECLCECMKALRQSRGKKSFQSSIDVTVNFSPRGWPAPTTHGSC